MNLPAASRNEVGRNRGANGGRFIGLFKANEAQTGFPNQIEPPAIGSALQSSVTGTAKPGAKVRVFRKATGSSVEIEGFLGQAVADGGGNWKATFAAVPVGTFVAATQTLDGGTSELSQAATAASDPPPDNAGGGGGGSGAGGSGAGGESSSAGSTPGGSTSGAGQQSPPLAEDQIQPRARITASPPKASRSTSVRLRFTSSVPGSRFQCRLDGAKFSGCHSPRTYRHLKPGRHVFRVRAIGPTGALGAVVRRVFTVS
jgi:hypothetical protein